MVSLHTTAHDKDEFSQRIKVFGDIWMVRIISMLADVTQRFNELHRSLGPVSPTVLADRLKKLEDYGLIARERQTMDQLSVTYALTDKGRAILPLLKSIESFTKKYL
ncbi:MAG TPA: helix-turn-helix domain-containing protein [Verrucomicrobiae bacterium]|nr:helix-turn-helix domain-containing protein [Verrucomicrobiae bacterium]